MRRLVDRPSAGKAKDQADGVNKAILTDLKRLDKSAKAKDIDDVKVTSTALRTHVLDFVALEPARLAEKFGVGDL